MQDLSWPVCTDCEGYGTYNEAKGHGKDRGAQCVTCKGTGRTEPKAPELVTGDVKVPDSFPVSDPDPVPDIPRRKIR